MLLLGDDNLTALSKPPDVKRLVKYIKTNYNM